MPIYKISVTYDKSIAHHLLVMYAGLRSAECVASLRREGLVSHTTFTPQCGNCCMQRSSRYGGHGTGVTRWGRGVLRRSKRTTLVRLHQKIRCSRRVRHTSLLRQGCGDTGTGTGNPVTTVLGRGVVWNGLGMGIIESGRAGCGRTKVRASWLFVGWEKSAQAVQMLIADFTAIRKVVFV